MVRLLMLPGVRLAEVLKPMSPPCSLMVYPGFIAMLTRTEPVALCVSVTVPTDPLIPRLLDVSPNETELAVAKGTASRNEIRIRAGLIREVAKYMTRVCPFRNCSMMVPSNLRSDG